MKNAQDVSSKGGQRSSHCLWLPPRFPEEKGGPFPFAGCLSSCLDQGQDTWGSDFSIKSRHGRKTSSAIRRWLSIPNQVTDLTWGRWRLLSPWGHRPYCKWRMDHYSLGNPESTVLALLGGPSDFQFSTLVGVGKRTQFYGRGVVRWARQWAIFIFLLCMFWILYNKYILQLWWGVRGSI